jgi:hypothetical protein
MKRKNMFVQKSYDPKTVNMTFIWKFKDAPEEYHVFWHACENPFCTCTEISIGIGLNTDRQPTVSICVDIFTKKCKIEYDLDNMAQRMISEMTDDDFLIVNSILKYEKMVFTESCDLSKVEPPDFDVRGIEEESLMVHYKEIFPWAEDYFVETKETKYFISEFYCLGTLCKCTKVSLSFYLTRNDVLVDEKKPTSVLFDYKTGKWEVQHKSDSTPTCSVLIQKMLEKYHDINRRFIKRVTSMKYLYQMYKKKKKLDIATKDISLTKTISRNDPCPCGSGKKYKKCCG